MLLRRKITNAIPLSVALALSGLPLAAQANTVSLSATASYSLDGGAAVNFSQSSTTNPSSVDVLDFTTSANGSSSGIHTYGDTGGSFGSRSSGSGVYDVNGHFVQDQTVFNTTGSALHYFYTFTLTGGEISASATTPFAAGQFADASYAANILVNGVSLFQTNAQVTMDSTGQSLIAGGTNIFTSGPSSCLSSAFCGVSWNTQTFTLDLGILAAGASLDLSYDLTTGASGNSPVLSAPTVQTYDPYIYVDSTTGNTVYDCTGGYGDGYGSLTGIYDSTPGSPTFGLCVDTSFQGAAPVGSSVARFGDPDFLSSQPIGNLPITVPEPGTIALLGAGLAGVAAIRRRRKNDKNAN